MTRWISQVSLLVALVACGGEASDRPESTGEISGLSASSTDRRGASRPEEPEATEERTSGIITQGAVDESAVEAARARPAMPRPAMPRVVGGSVNTVTPIEGVVAPPAGSSASIWIASAREASAIADGAEDAVAWRTLEDFLRRPVPAEVAPEHRRILRQDAWYRLGRLALEAGDHETAVAQAERGLAEGRELDLFTASLLTLRGQAYEASGAMDRASDDYYAALRVNEALLEQALED